jgi:hypothetical protein
VTEKMGFSMASDFNELVKPYREEILRLLKEQRALLRAEIQQKGKGGPSTEIGKPLWTITYLEILEKQFAIQKQNDVDVRDGQAFFVAHRVNEYLQKRNPDGKFAGLRAAYESMMGIHTMLEPAPGKPVIIYISPTSGFHDFKLGPLVDMAKKHSYGLLVVDFDPAGTIDEISSKIKSALETSPVIRRLKEEGRTVVVTFSGSSTFYQAVVKKDLANGSNGITYHVPVCYFGPVLNGSELARWGGTMPAPFLFIAENVIMEYRAMGNMLWNNLPGSKRVQELLENSEAITAHIGPKQGAIFIEGDRHTFKKALGILKQGPVTQEVLNHYKGKANHALRGWLRWVMAIQNTGGKLSIVKPPENASEGWKRQVIHEQLQIEGPQKLEELIALWGLDKDRVFER